MLFTRGLDMLITAVSGTHSILDTLYGWSTHHSGPKPQQIQRWPEGPNAQQWANEQLFYLMVNYYKSHHFNNN